MFEWNQKYSVGIHSIDAQHRNLFAVARELYDAMSAGLGKSTLSRILDRLVQYTQVHFAHEERLMKQNAYPNLVEHQEQHAALTRQLLMFQADFKSGRATMTVQLLNFLRSWLEQHIRIRIKPTRPT